MLTKQQLRAAARHARELAMECVNGAAPLMNRWDYCGCATAEVAKRAGMSVSNAEYEPAVEIDKLLIEDTGECAGRPWAGVVSIGLRDYGPEGIVFPLLALADELENAAKAAPKALP